MQSITYWSTSTISLETPQRRARRARDAARRRAEQPQLPARRCIVSDTEQLLAIEGIWYHVEVAITRAGMYDWVLTDWSD